MSGFIIAFFNFFLFQHVLEARAQRSGQQRCREVRNPLNAPTTCYSDRRSLQHYGWVSECSRQKYIVFYIPITYVDL